MNTKLRKGLAGLGMIGLMAASGSAGSALNQSHRQEYFICEEVINLTDAQYMILREAVNNSLNEGKDIDDCFFQFYNLQLDNDFNEALLERNVGKGLEGIQL